MTFGEALERAKDFKRIARQGWDNKYVTLLDPGPNAEMTQPYLYQCSESGEKCPWAPSHQELLADDWEIA